MISFNKTVYIISSILLISLFSECRKVEDPNLKRENHVGGCTDPDSPLYNEHVDYEDQSCLYAFTYKYEITYYNLNNGDDWDDHWCITSQYYPADLILRIKPANDSNWIFESPVNEDQAHDEITEWIAPDAVKLYNTNYMFELIDEDGSGNWTCDTGSDLIYTGIFNPIENAENGVSTMMYKIGNDSLQLKIYYDLKQEY